MIGQTLQDYLAQHCAREAMGDSLQALVNSFAKAAIETKKIIAEGALSAAFAGQTGGQNTDGDVQKELDVLADDIFLAAAREANVCLYASEELDQPVRVKDGGELIVAIDPLDGSSNIDTNVSVGTIFSVLPAHDCDHSKDSVEDLERVFQKGKAQIASGFFIYGPQLALAFTLGKGTYIFVYSESQQNFVIAYDHISLPKKTKEYAINASNMRHWDSAISAYVGDCLEGEEGFREQNFNMRWVASLVADTYRILIRGGVFLYPGDKRRGYAQGRLRLIYEANPIAFLIEQAGGLATNGEDPIMELQPKAVHQRTPLMFGSQNEIETVLRYTVDTQSLSGRSPLFRNRGLFAS